MKRSDDYLDEPVLWRRLDSGFELGEVLICTCGREIKIEGDLFKEPIEVRCDCGNKYKIELVVREEEI